MTQKELLYYEDAISHEDNIIKICDDMINTLEDEEIVSFMENQIQIHTNLKDKLFDVLEEKSNGW